MAEVKVFYDKVGNTLTVWFGDPNQEHVSEETGDEVLLMKDSSGRVIGFEKLNFTVANRDIRREAVALSARQIQWQGYSGQDCYRGQLQSEVMAAEPGRTKLVVVCRGFLEFCAGHRVVLDPELCLGLLHKRFDHFAALR